MIAHQAISPYRQTILRAIVRQPAPIRLALFVAEEHWLAPVATMRDVIRNSRNDNPRVSSHNGPE